VNKAFDSLRGDTGYEEVPGRGKTFDELDGCGGSADY